MCGCRVVVVGMNSYFRWRVLWRCGNWVSSRVVYCCFE